MNHDEKPRSKILQHGRGAGEVTAEAIEHRARELALIAGRPENDIRPEDRRRAWQEMTAGGDRETTVGAPAEATGSLGRDPAEPVSLRGRQTPRRGGDDEKAELESLALEGVDEAQHEQMLADRTRRKS